MDYTVSYDGRYGFVLWRGFVATTKYDSFPKVLAALSVIPSDVTFKSSAIKQLAKELKAAEEAKHNA